MYIKLFEDNPNTRDILKVESRWHYYLSDGYNLCDRL